jgi:DNA-binding MarR family transcriptional regulator
MTAQGCETTRQARTSPTSSDQQPAEKLRDDKFKTYVKVLDEYLADPNLKTLADIFIVAFCDRYEAGWYQSSAQIAALLREHPRTIQKRIRRLVKKGYIARTPPDKNRRWLFRAGNQKAAQAFAAKCIEITARRLAARRRDKNQLKLWDE